MALTLQPIRGFPPHSGKPNTINDGDSKTSLSPIFLRGRGVCAHSIRLSVQPNLRLAVFFTKHCLLLCLFCIDQTPTVSADGQNLNSAETENTVFITSLLLGHQFQRIRLPNE